MMIAVFVKMLHQVHDIVQVIVVEPVVPLVKPVKLNVLGLVVVKPVG